MSLQKLTTLLITAACTGQLYASSPDFQVDLEGPFVCEVKGDNTLMRLGRGVSNRTLEINKTNKYETQLDEFEVGCYRTTQGLKCSDYFNIAQVEINAADIHESCPFWKDRCEKTIEGQLTYRQKNMLGLRATEIYELECSFQEI